MKHHHLALVVILSALALDCCLGVWLAATQHISVLAGVSYALGVATTSGSTVAVKSTHTELIQQDIMQLTIIPLFAFSVTLVTSALSAVHVRRAKKEIMDAQS